MSALSSSATLGRDLRALRKTRGLTLNSVASAVDRSVGWLSQVERDLSAPSLDEVRALSRVLDVDISTVMGPTPASADEAGRIVRHNNRRPIGKRAEGLVEELLSPDLTDDFEVVHSTFRAGAERVEPVTRPTQEVGFIVSGRLEVTIDGQVYDLGPGDSFRTRGEPMTWANRTENDCVVIWVIAPPVY